MIEQIRDIKGDDIDKYRFETGSLYEYDKDQNAYICVYTDYRKNTMAKAVKAYEKDDFPAQTYLYE